MPKCPLCGREVDSRGMYGHIDSLNCQLRQTRNIVQEKGLAKCGHINRILQDAGIPVKRLLTCYSPGFRGRKAKPYYAYFAPKEVVLVYSVLKERNTPRNEIVAFFKSEAAESILDAARLLLALNTPEEVVKESIVEMAKNLKNEKTQQNHAF